MRLPDEAKTLIIRGKDGEFRGQATFWKRGKRWTMIGVTKSMNWLHYVDFGDVKKELKKRGLVFEWRQAMPFTAERLNPKGIVYGWV